MMRLVSYFDSKTSKLPVKTAWTYLINYFPEKNKQFNTKFFSLSQNYSIYLTNSLYIQQGLIYTDDF